MIFAARGILVSLAFFAVVYCTLSSLVVLLAWSMNRVGGQTSARSANFLFGLRIFSFAVSSAAAVFFAFPSFWLMEKATLDEDAGTFVLAACSLLILGAGLVRVLRAQAKTTRAVRQWLSRTPSMGGSEADTLALSAWNGAPALILVGIQRPQVMISDRAAMVLSGDELQAAVRHEMGHMRSWDNLKKVFISATSVSRDALHRECVARGGGTSGGRCSRGEPPGCAGSCGGADQTLEILEAVVGA